MVVRTKALFFVGFRRKEGKEGRKKEERKEGRQEGRREGRKEGRKKERKKARKEGRKEGEAKPCPSVVLQSPRNFLTPTQPLPAFFQACRACFKAQEAC